MGARPWGISPDFLKELGIGIAHPAQTGSITTSRGTVGVFAAQAHTLTVKAPFNTQQLSERTSVPMMSSQPAHQLTTRKPALSATNPATGLNALELGSCTHPGN